MTAKRGRGEATSGADDEAQRRLIGAAIGRDREQAGADSKAKDGQTPLQEGARQPELGPEARQKIAADDAQRAGAEQDETVEAVGAGSAPCLLR